MPEEASVKADAPNENLMPQSGGAPQAENGAPSEVCYEIAISADQLEAHLRIRAQGSARITPEEIKKFLGSKKVCHGVIPDEKIQQYLDRGSILEEPCLVAQGTPPEPGRDAEVTYHFERDPLKIGSIRTGGAIDFKNKGEIPQVIEGDLLGEKIPLVRGKPGTDVFGNPIPVVPARDIPFFSGTGAKRSADGLKIYSRIRGRPELMGGGRVCVFPEIKIKGDVGVGTGHIRFDGFVDVEGTIQEGYKVKAGRLAAKEVFRSEVEADGDIVVAGGIVGAKVTGRGNLKTRFIHSSRISVLGDVIVEREVIDSRIETNGALMAVPGGRVFTSQIIAKKGISAGQIGSPTSKPCALKFGVDSNVEGMIKKMEEEIAQKKAEKKRVRDSLERFTHLLRPVQDQVVKYTQVQDQLNGQLLAHKELIEGYKGEEDRSRLGLAQRESRKLQEKLRWIEEELRKAVIQQDQAGEKVSAVESRSEELEASVHALQDAIHKAREESQSKIKPPVKVLKQIFSGTLLEGCHSSQVLRESLESVLIQEIPVTHKSPEGDELSGWAIEISPL